MSDVDATQFGEALGEIKSLRTDFANHVTDDKAEHKDMGDRVRKLEDWRLQLVTKVSIYTALAMFAGTMVSQFAIKLFLK